MCVQNFRNSKAGHDPKSVGNHWLKVLGLLSSSSLIYSHHFSWYVLRPSLSVSCWTWQPTHNLEPNPSLNPFGLNILILLSMGYLSHYPSKPSATAINSRGPQKTHTTPLKYTANSVCHLLGSWTFFSVTFCFLKKKRTTRYTQKKNWTGHFAFFY